MRKWVWVVAILALAGCDQGKRGDVPPPKPTVATSPAAAAAPQWDLEVRGEITQAVSDLSGWLIEHSFVSSVVRENGKTRILMGPYGSEAEAKAKQAEVQAALVRAKKQNIELLVIERPLSQ
ncbi:SPOR domain-containing protein [Pseudomonas gregormendelii]|uniref:SPOR domain-containing protein n=1 Tax=Pseudomonas gregormendelii TaxID=1628277 RepID=A0ABS3AKH1_9PSED|nr:SPOR domain-containing protein [Pseudomonas gregormendelii]